MDLFLKTIPDGAILLVSGSFDIGADYCLVSYFDAHHDGQTEDIGWGFRIVIKQTKCVE